jgi:hypothetical protein
LVCGQGLPDSKGGDIEWNFSGDFIKKIIIYQTFPTSNELNLTFPMENQENYTIALRNLWNSNCAKILKYAPLVLGVTRCPLFKKKQNKSACFFENQQKW